jgi:hypothetical protein
MQAKPGCGLLGSHKLTSSANLMKSIAQFAIKLAVGHYIQKQKGVS